MSDDDRKLRQLLDKEDIRTTMATYCRGMDRVWPDLIAGVYSTESWDHHGAFSGSGRDFALDSDPARLRQTSFNRIGHHLLGQSLIDFVSDDEAECETYFWATGLNDTDSGRKLFLLAGRYLDRFVRTEAGWRLHVRRAVIDVSQYADSPSTWPPADAYTAGKRWPKDAVFNFDDMVTMPRT